MDFWLITITGTTLPLEYVMQQLTEIPHGKLFTAAVSIRQGVPLGILVFLPSLPWMDKTNYQAHI